MTGRLKCSFTIRIAKYYLPSTLGGGNNTPKSTGEASLKDDFKTFFCGPEVILFWDKFRTIFRPFTKYHFTKHNCS